MECVLLDSHRGLDNGKVNQKAYFYQDKLVVDCNEDYISKDDVECQIDGTWNKEAECVPSGSELNILFVL